MLSQIRDVSFHVHASARLAEVPDAKVSLWRVCPLQSVFSRVLIQWSGHRRIVSDRAQNGVLPGVPLIALQ